MNNGVIVHNAHVVRRLKENGVIFVENIDEVPEGSHVIYSAHGVSPEVRKKSNKLNLKVLDATCPLVTKVHVEAKKYSKIGLRYSMRIMRSYTIMWLLPTHIVQKWRRN